MMSLMFGACTEHQRHHSSPAGADAAGSRARVWFIGRKYFSGRADARTAFLSATRAGLGAVSFADQEPLHVRIGHASGRRDYGRERAECGTGDSEGSEMKVSSLEFQVSS